MFTVCVIPKMFVLISLYQANYNNISLTFKIIFPYTNISGLPLNMET